MSFDWLNVPGLSGSGNENIEAAEPPPSVSFNFGNSASEPPTERESHVTMPQRADRADAFHSQSSYDSASSSAKSQARPDNYMETKEDLQVPLSLSRTQLTREEVRTYLRWYGYIASRKHTKLIALDDVFHFMTNFPLGQDVKERIAHIFKTCKNALNIGQFFAILRLIARALTDGVLPTRKMIMKAAPVPKPKPILAAGNEEVYEEIDDSQDGPELKVDFDSFASLLLTGQKKKRMRRRITNDHKRSKRVRFTDKLVTFQDHVQSPENEQGTEDEEKSGDNEPLDLSLPMDQLLKKMAARKKNNSALVSEPPSQKVPESQEEKEVLEDMKESLNHFHQIHNVDSVSLGGVPAQVPSAGTPSANATAQIEPLKPTATGSANYLFRSSQQQPQSVNQEPLQPLKPTATGSANYLFRSSQQQATSQKPEHNSFNFMHAVSPDPSNNAMHRNNTTFQSPTPEIPQIRAPLAANFAGQPLHSSSQAPSNLNVPFSNQSFLPPPSSGFGISPQPTSQNNFSPNLSANNYFQNLLSSSPSPNASTLQLPQSASVGPYANAYSSNSKVAQDSNYLKPNLTGPSNPQYQINPNQYQRREYQSFTPSPVPTLPSYPQAPQNTYKSHDYLGDLRALQEHVDQLQNAYNR
ncbi:Scd5p [Lachancea thermotolerans CBS 6340]|uniref:KLTH0D02024p n=1 Tax=Lachancea thermotolerans (strain ATCC 56472 / CBS 6340 / NRRL Y-8284) TaxID=559295 RepID=C5DG32_LACTC|nr:KLTH0D02024p [Lachancea thermotolerans CBS 6340]CAR22374.1 KLTH0D02024p [Lachancea thermotolerans CBS 6340]